MQCCTTSDRHGINTSDIVIPDSIYLFFPNSEQSKKMQNYFESSNAIQTTNDKIWFFSDTHYYLGFENIEKAYFDSLIIQYRDMSIANLKASDDSAYFIISTKDELKKLYTLNTLEKIYKQYKDKHMLPSFHSLMKNRHEKEYQTICGLPEDYEICIIKSGRKFILPDNLYYDWNVLPLELKHGYTSGVAYNKDKIDIIYWVITW